MRKVLNFSFIFMFILLFVGCKKENNKKEIDSTNIVCKENDILTYEPVDTNKLVITIGNNMNANLAPLKEDLEKKFSKINVVFTIGNNYDYLMDQGENNDLADILFYAGNKELSKYFYDLSALPFTSRYNLTSLESLSVDNKIYQLPVASSGVGIFYNKTLFEENNWEVPKTLDEFYELCKTIQEEGIRPFAPCFKYAATIADVGMGLSNRELFGDIYKTADFIDFCEGTISSEGVMEPFLTSLKKLYQEGLISESDFSSSATQIRQKMYEGEIAMVPYNLNLVSFYDEEKPDCELGFMGFPTDEENERYLSFSHEDTCMSLSRYSMEDELKKEVLLEIFDYLSTNEGQTVLFKCFTGISNVKTFQSNITSRFDEVIECMNNGRMYFGKQFWTNDNISIIKDFIIGDMEISTMLKHLDDFVKENISGEKDETVFGYAEDNFTVLETSLLIAEAFKEKTNAEIGLVLNNYNYKGNLMNIYKGDITNSGIFYCKGFSGTDTLTVYEISGKNLKELLEHPIVLGSEVNALYAASGLKITYAPWNDLNNNIISVTLSDGSEIEDDKLYKVAGWATSIDEKYITNTLNSYNNYNSIILFMEEYLKEVGRVRPFKDGRITLVWDK